MARSSISQGRWPGRLAFAAAAMGAGLVCALGAYGWLAWSDSGSYLGLQAGSDTVHLLAIYTVPTALAILALTWMLSELARLRAWLRWTGRSLVASSLAVLIGLPAFVLVYDLRLENRGRAGELIVTAAPVEPAGDELPVGVHREPGVSQPNLAVEGLSGGDLLTLDRRTLARRRTDGSFAWHLPRPGPPPGTLSFTPGQAFYAGPGPRFEDDVLLLAIDLATGHLRWQRHCLGDGISEAVADRDLLLFSTWRPATSTIHALRPDSGRSVWHHRLAGVVRLSPQPRAGGLAVAVDGDLLLLDATDGRPLSRGPACAAPETTGVVCRDGQVVAWRRGVIP